MSSPVGRGLKIENEGVEHLVVNWMGGQPVPDAVLDLLVYIFAKRSVH